MGNPYKQAVKWILEILVKEQKFFEQNHNCLAYMFYFHDEVHYGSRYDKNKRLHDNENPKNALIEIIYKVSKKYGDLLSDASVATMDYRTERGDEVLPLEKKMNKTVDDWIDIKLNPKYRYHGLYPARRQALDYLLCRIGSGENWNKDGYISDIGPGGADLCAYMDFKKSFKDLPKYIQDRITETRNDPIVSKGIAASAKAKKEHEEDRASLKDLIGKMDRLLTGEVLEKHLREKAEREEDQKTEPFRDLNRKHSALFTMPKNAHSSYVLAGIEICNMILENPREEEDNVKVAKKYLPKLMKRLGTEQKE